MLQIVIARPQSDGRTPFLRVTPVFTGLDSINTLFHSSQTIVDALRECGELTNVFYTLAHHRGAAADMTVAVRTRDTFDYQECIAFDCDGLGVFDHSKTAPIVDIVATTLCVDPNCMTVVSTGNGLHIIIHVATPIRYVTFFEGQNKRAYRILCDVMTDKLAELGYDPEESYFDPSIFEPARILRMPGTLNWKEKRGEPEPRQTALLQIATSTVDVNLRSLAKIDELDQSVENLTAIRRTYPTPDGQAIVSGCPFIRSVLREPHQYHEPDFFDALSYIMLFSANEEIRFEVCSRGGEISEKALQKEGIVNYLYDNADASLSMRAQSTSARRMKRAFHYANFGPRLCSTIEMKHPLICGECPNRCLISSPIRIRGADKLQWEESGFWVINEKGVRKEPAYYDLVSKQLQSESLAVHRTATSANPDVWGYDPERGVWTELPTDAAHLFIQSHVRPENLLKKRHREEYEATLRVKIPRLDTEFFTMNEAARNKLNCLNGVLDLKTGELLPHAPEYGFTTQINVNYDPAARSTFFDGWLTAITADGVLRPNETRKKLVLSIMAYSLLNQIDDHAFFVFYGTGRNGKSTIFEILKAILSKSGYSALTMQDLSHEYKLPFLFGKSCNISEESDTGEGTRQSVGAAACGLIKLLCAGGEVTANRKYKDPLVFKNTAKMIFSYNELPHFQDGSTAFMRRYVLVPFKNEFARPDARVGRRLCTEELPGILSLLVATIQELFEQNDGVLRIPRLEDAMGIIKESNFDASPVEQWMEEKLDVGRDICPDSYETVTALWLDFTSWCEQNAVKYVPAQRTFIQKIKSVIKLPATESPRMTLNGKRARVITYCRFKKNQAEVGF